MSVLENLSEFEYLNFTLSAQYELFPNIQVTHHSGNICRYGNIICANRIELKTTPVEFYNNDAHKSITFNFRNPIKFTKAIGAICNVHTNSIAKGYDNISVPFNITGSSQNITIFSGDAIGKTNSPPELVVDDLIIDFILILI